MNVDVLLGLQWGDEGKGKIVDVLAPSYKVIARFQGGPNAGHTLEFENRKHVLHTIPSGIFRPGTVNLIGNGVVIDPVIFKKEITELGKFCPELHKSLFISKRAHLIVPTHRLLDAAYEKAKGNTKIGSTLKGIGPAYTDKIARQGIRIGDIALPGFSRKYSELKEAHNKILNTLGHSNGQNNLDSEWFSAIETIKEFKLVDGEIFIRDFIGQKVLAEGAQGTMLDIDIGSYPYVTSSNTVCAGACTGLGIPPSAIKKVYGIFKAYCTRVGSGPFPTELNDNTGELLRKSGNEFGSTTGRPRRCGWLDLVALRYSVNINGVTNLIMTKADVMNDFDEIKAAVAYNTGEITTENIPFDLNEDIRPMYVTFKGWKKNINNARDKYSLPEELLIYIRYIEEFVNVPVSIVSVGPDRNEIVVIE